ncbi:hypothetical protein GTS_53550 [Gandjariella thermophila]|uniref:Uncharacterized protein n=1 Tax=Gandjariella thermophila TaxID=1931992 RepID=A0A4D4JE84_9PSEU|nr:hypothetical protein GTS_53550 [Gandjariella thermophila]
MHWRFHAMLNREKGTILLDLTWPRQETGGPEGLGQERCEVPIDKLQQAANRYGSVHVVLDQLYLAIFEKHNIKPPAVPLRMVRGGTRARSVNNSGGGPIEFE